MHVLGLYRHGCLKYYTLDGGAIFPRGAMHGGARFKIYSDTTRQHVCEVR